jgi:hypothetical protein
VYRLFTAVVRDEDLNSVKFRIQLYAIWCKERKRKHNEVKIAISNFQSSTQCSSGENETKYRRLFTLKMQLAFIVFQRRSLQSENEAKTKKAAK